MNEKHTILYVDDEPVNLQLFRINLREKFNVLTVSSGADGLEMLMKEPKIEVVISDMKMPNMSGMEFIKLAKEKHPVINYYILTGYDITDEIHDALDTGLILKYFKKPFNMNEMIIEITKVVEP